MWIQIAGLVIGSLSMIGAAFATEPWHLLITIGIFYPAFGGKSVGSTDSTDLRSVYDINYLVTYLPCSTLLFEWFYTRRGLAGGIMFSGTGLGGCIFPFLVSGMLERFGYRATMISLGLGFIVLGGISLIPIKRRIPYTRGRGLRRGGVNRFSAQSKYLLTKPMLVGALIIFLIGMGNFIPSLWIPSEFSYPRLPMEHD